MEIVVVIVIVLILIASSVICLARRYNKKRKTPAIKTDEIVEPAALSSSVFQISYVPSGRQWSGSTSGSMPIRTLTYKQYECLEDARYGFMIVGASPKQRKEQQLEKTRAHGLKTVASLVKHGFLMTNGLQAYVITDHGLNALAVCDVRY